MKASLRGRQLGILRLEIGFPVRIVIVPILVPPSAVAIELEDVLAAFQSETFAVGEEVVHEETIGVGFCCWIHKLKIFNIKIYNALFFLSCYL